MFYVEPGPAPGTSMAYWGPEIRVGIPQPALNVDMDAHTNVESLSFSFDPTKGVLPIVFIQNPMTRIADPDPDPEHHSAAAAARRAAPPIAEAQAAERHGEAEPGAGDRRGMAEAAKSQDSVTANGRLDVAALRARAQGAAAGRRARRGLAFDGLYYVKSVTHAQARRVQAELQPGAQRPDLDHSCGCRYERREVSTASIGDRAQQHRPDADRPDPGAGARRRRAHSRTWAMPCVPVAGIQTGMFTVPIIGVGRVGRVRAGRPGLSDLGRLLLGLAPRRCRRCRALTPPAAAGDHDPDDAAERAHDQRRARPDRRHHAEDATGAMFSSATSASTSRTARAPPSR